MSLSTASVDLANAFKTVRLVWEETREEWHDPVRDAFEADRWVPLENHVRTVLQAMDRLTPILSKALRDCS